ncbi:MAG: RNA methyltransferase [Chloroflexi bacterium HGW-Chloroflexi-4]|nr:MAG: RNA methyltransferase [Chloroflexi bacterium HGW-Chloroflexi-7]PKN97652.1 MAG: RNA methyltransferase [Chloroflexi bacterium HGW-Chloroflexi-4]
MAFNYSLAQRVSLILNHQNMVEKKMFGGVGYLLNGNMVCGVHEDNLIVRVGTERYKEILDLPNTKLFDLTGKAMTGWVEVLPTGTRTDQELIHWINLGMEFAKTLPPK